MESLKTIKKNFGPTIKKVQRNGGRYPIELKEKVTKLHDLKKATSREIAKALGINPAQVYHWKEDLNKKSKKGSGLKVSKRKSPELKRQAASLDPDDVNAMTDYVTEVVSTALEAQASDKKIVLDGFEQTINDVVDRLHEIEDSYFDYLSPEGSEFDHTTATDKVEYAEGLLIDLHNATDKLSDVLEVFKNSK